MQLCRTTIGWRAANSDWTASDNSKDVRMPIDKSFNVVPIGYIHSLLKERNGAPRQGWEGAPDARIEIDPEFVECLDGIQSGQDIWVLTWLHESRRSVRKVHPRGDLRNPMMGVFATRSPDRPNPIGLHRTNVLSVESNGWLQVQRIEAIDGTPIIDIKPVLLDPSLSTPLPA